MIIKTAIVSPLEIAQQKQNMYPTLQYPKIGNKYIFPQFFYLFQIGFHTFTFC